MKSLQENYHLKEACLPSSPFLSRLNDIVIYLNANNQIIEFNLTAENYFQCKKQEVLDENFIAFLQRNNFEYPSWLENIEVSLKNNEAKEFNQIIKVKSGKQHSAIWKIYPITDNNYQGAILIGFDTTYIRKVESDAKNIKKRLEAAIETIAGNHWWKDIDGRYMGCNATVAKLLGLESPSEIIGKTDYQMPWAETAEELVKNDLEVMKSEKAQTREEHAMGKNAKLFTFLATKVPLRDENGKIIGTVGTSVDITEQKNAEAQLKIAKEKAENADRAKSAFIANMSHDLRTPLTGIIGIAEFLEKHVAKKYREITHKVVQSSQGLLVLFNEIIEYIKIETSSQNYPLQQDQFEIKTILANIVNLITPLAKQKKLKLQVHVDPAISPFLMGDIMRLRRIILNLVNNAIKFTLKGKITITAQLVNETDDDITMQIIIEDTGIGIPEDQLEHIFERFTRLTSSYQGEFEGIGLGLSIVKGFIKDMQGEIHVKSQLNKGSQFICTIPFKKDKKSPEEQVDSSSSTLKVDNSQIKMLNPLQSLRSNKNRSHAILLIEDDLISQKICQLNLEEFNCSVDITSSGKKAVTMFKKNNYELVITDIGLPDIDGEEVTRLIRKWEKNTKKQPTPIVALTAGTDTKNRAMLLQAGVNEVFAKPLLRELADKLLESYCMHYSRIKNGKKLKSFKSYNLLHKNKKKHSVR